jgi:hypothetical protein
MWRVICFGVLCLICQAGGCSGPTWLNPTADGEAPGPTPQRVELTNLTTRTQAANPSCLSIEQFLARATQLQQEGKAARLQGLVARYPDVALEMLRGTGPDQAAKPERRAVAQGYDRLFLAPGQAYGWARTLEDMAQRPEGHQADFDARWKAKRFIEQGRSAALLQSSAPEGSAAAAAAPFLVADALRLQGIAWLLNNRPDRAAEMWQRARALAAPDACVAGELDMLSCQALRKAGRVSDSAAAWQRAATELAAVHDPILWQRLLEGKPADAAWPAEVRAALARRESTTMPARPAGGEGFDEGLLWWQVAQWRLERNETSASLLAFTHAESQARSEEARSRGRIGQARALLVMGQDPPAMVILAAEIQSPQPATACQALAVLGAVRLQQGQVQQGLAMLRQAVQNPSGARWPGYSLAQADLALACLDAGKDQEAQGLRLLHEAQDAFAREGCLAELCQCLTNEADYLRKAGRTDEVTQVLDRKAKAEATPAAPAPSALDQAAVPE